MSMQIRQDISKKPSKHNMYYMKNIKRYKMLYLMVIPGVLYFLIFKFLPLGGMLIAFQDYSIFKGFLGSDFVGLKHFINLFNYGDFKLILGNTLLMSLYDVLLGFPAPIILALIINEISNGKFKKTVQSIVYLPHFLSWAVLGGIVIVQILSPEYGLANHMLRALGKDPIYFMTKPEYARGIVILSGIWRDMGWGTIIYLAAITGINPNLYEAASIDGASRFKQVLVITVPAIMNVVVVLFLLKMGRFMESGFDRFWVFLNDINRSKIEIFDTYVYQSGLLEGRFSYTTAVSVFKSVVGFCIMFTANKFSKKVTGDGIY